LVGEDRRIPKKFPKVPHLNVTIINVNRATGLRDSILCMLAEAILANEVLIRNNKIPGQRKAIML
jgi:hypothetical protein